jgi:SAM-dependent methyltransferase
MIDWGRGRYEHTATELEPVSVHVVAVANPGSGERVLDLATGTGNAALLAARAGATVTGVDVSERLLDVAHRRASEAGVEAAFVVGGVETLPFADGSFDVALSVFGLIFAADPDRAFAEMMRVLTPAGRAVLSAWIPAGPMDAMVGVFSRALAEVTGQSSPRFPWHDREAVTELAGRHGASVRFDDGELEITADSPQTYLHANAQHPMSVAARPVLERAGIEAEVRARALAALEAGNEDPDGFRIHSPYRLIEVRTNGDDRRGSAS